MRWGSGGDGLSFNSPNGIAIDSADHVYTTEFQGHRVRKFTPEGELLAEWGGLGSEPGQLRSPTGIAVGRDGRIYVAESGGHRIQVFSSEGMLLDTWGAFGDGPGEFASAMTVALDDDKRIYVSDWGNSRVQVFDSAGRFLNQIGSSGTGSGEMTNPTGVAIGPEGNLWVMDRGNSRIQQFTLDGILVQVWTQAGRGQFNSPTNIAFDEDGNWWVSEFTENRVRQFSPDGEMLLELAPGTCRGPHGLLFDSTDALYVADTGNGVVRKFRLTTSTLAPTPILVPTVAPSPIPILAVSQYQSQLVVFEGAVFNAELSFTPEQRARGLMGRGHLGDRDGMLFIYELEGLHGFWMRGMLIPLDMVWIDAAGVVAGVTANVSPAPKGTNPEIYSPPRPIQYVLEINAGLADQVGIRAGSLARFVPDFDDEQKPK